MKSNQLLWVLVFVPVLVFSQQEVKSSKNVWQVLWGEAPKSSVSLLPVGTHTSGFKFNDFYGVFYGGYNYKALEVNVFKNSYRDWTLGLLYKRRIPLGSKWSIDYGGGLLYGYKGRLQNVSGIPFKKLLFSHPINPVVGGGINYKITKRLSATILIAPLINIYGFRYDL